MKDVYLEYIKNSQHTKLENKHLSFKKIGKYFNRHFNKADTEVVARGLSTISQCKLKPLWDTTRHLLQRLKFKRPIIPSVGNDSEGTKLTYTIGGNVKQATTLEKFGTLLTYTCHIIHHPIPKYIPKNNKGIYPCKNLYIIVHSSLINTIQKLEIIQMSINRWMHF